MAVIVRVIQNTQVHGAGKMQGFVMLRLVVDKFTSVLYSFNVIQWLVLILSRLLVTKAAGLDW
jgi:hypothetical protein